MASDLTDILSIWSKDRDLDWVLATLVCVEGSSYRKPGAIMLINGFGQYYGMLSGGCLEADIVLKSSQVLNDGKARIIRYDMQDESNISWQLGIGCGGCIDILLQPVNKKNHYLALDQVLDQLSQGKTCHYLQGMDELSKTKIIENSNQQRFFSDYAITRNQEGQWFVNLLKPNPHIAIFGGGIDAIPLTNFARELNWQVTLCDPRSAYARDKNFPSANTIIKNPIPSLKGCEWLNKIDAAVIMHHNIKLDAQALELLQTSSARFIGMLGPGHRTQRVVAETSLNGSQLNTPLHNPIGLDLGGDSPSSIALSIVAQIQSVLNQTSAQSLGMYDQSLEHSPKSATGDK